MIQEEVLLSFLIQKNFLSEQQARAVLNEAKNLNQRVEEVIISKNLIDEKKLVQAKGELFQLPVKFFEANESVPRGVLNLISEDVSRTYFCLAFNKEGSTVSIGMVYPDDVRAQETVKFLMRSLGLDFRVYVISLSDALVIESGLRGDFVKNYGFELLPRVSVMLRLTPKITTRVGGRPTRSANAGEMSGSLRSAASPA